MVAALVAGSLFTRQLLWTPISAVNMIDVATNQFKISGAVFSGIDKKGEPFRVRAASGRQEYGNPDIIYLERVAGTVNRTSGGRTITDNISARAGRFNVTENTFTLIGDVHINSSNGDTILTKELVIRL